MDLSEANPGHGIERNANIVAAAPNLDVSSHGHLTVNERLHSGSISRCGNYTNDLKYYPTQAVGRARSLGRSLIYARRIDVHQGSRQV